MSSNNKSGASSASSSTPNKRDSSGNNSSTSKKTSEGSSSDSLNSSRDTPKSTRGLDHGLEIPPFLVATSGVRAAKAQAVGKIAPSLMAPVTTSKAGGKCTLTPEIRKRIRSEYFRILHQKRVRLKEDAKSAWIRNFEGNQGRKNGGIFFLVMCPVENFLSETEIS